MKKKIVFGLLVLGCGLLFSAEPGIGNKVSRLTSNNYRFFSGFSFENLPSTDHKESLKERVNSEIDYVIQEDKEYRRKNKYAIVGQSQGGLRVLAYASMLEKRITDETLSEQERRDAKENFERLGAVITISGIDRGLKAIENNFSTFKVKVTKYANTLLAGLNGAGMALPTVGGLVNPTVFFLLEIQSADDIVKFCNLIVPGFFEGYIKDGWYGAGYSKIPEIYDMVPHSNFIEENVSSTSEVQYMVQTGTYKYINWEQVAPAWWWWVPHEDPVYTTYTAYKDNPKFSSELPVGYIVGTKSNTLSLAGEDEAGIRNGIEIAAGVFETAQIINHAATYLAGGLFIGTYTAYQECCAARDVLRNIDGVMNDLVGSSEHDGLVAKESQFYPKKFYNPATKQEEEVHSNVLGEDDKGYVTVDKNHRETVYVSNYIDELNIMLAQAHVIEKN